MEDGEMDDSGAQEGGIEETEAERQIEECLVYFRQAIAEPLSVPPWSEWWEQNAELVERVFPLMEYVRVKHRKLLGARQILQRGGELPPTYAPPSPRLTGSCGECGERVTNHVTQSENTRSTTCPHCGTVFVEPDDADAAT